MRNPKFTTKEEYLAYRKQWKVDYKELSAAIRNEKLVWKDYNRNPIVGYYHERGGWVRSRPWTEREAERVEKYNEDIQKWKVAFGISHLPKYRLSGLATQMLEELKEAKLESQRQYLASKNLVPA
jgi:hypothetical protein